MKGKKNNKSSKLTIDQLKLALDTQTRVSDT